MANNTTPTKTSKPSTNREFHLKEVDKYRFSSKFVEKHASVAVTVDFRADTAAISFTNSAGVDKDATVKAPTLMKVLTKLSKMAVAAHEYVKSDRFMNLSKEALVNRLVKVTTISDIRDELNRQISYSSKAKNRSIELLDAHKRDIEDKKAKLKSLRKQVTELEYLDTK